MLPLPRGPRVSYACRPLVLLGTHFADSFRLSTGFLPRDAREVSGGDAWSRRPWCGHGLTAAGWDGTEGRPSPPSLPLPFVRLRSPVGTCCILDAPCWPVVTAGLSVFPASREWNPVRTTKSLPVCAHRLQTERSHALLKFQIAEFSSQLM